MRVIDEVDEKSTRERVNVQRQSHSEATADELVELLVKRECIQTGAIGAVTSTPTTIPGIGTIISLIFGVAADIGMTFKRVVAQ